MKRYREDTKKRPRCTFCAIRRKEQIMAAFERILSGHKGLDEALDNIRLGDNVVWQVTRLEDFKYFMERFVKQAIADGRNLIYMRFASHEPLLEPQPGLKICEFDPDQGFETFTVEIHNRIAEEGYDAFYVFDSLSSLQSVWYTDLMMGNFFRLTCPFLFELDTVAYFPLLRGRHSYSAVAKIRDTTQLLLDVHSADRLYVHPLKVWNRYLPEMFLPHACSMEDDSCVALGGGVPMSRYYRIMEEVNAKSQDQNLDSHDRFFALARLEYQRGNFSEETENLIIESTMTKDKRLHERIREYFEPKDYFVLRDRMVGSGSIGGKACGMLLARRIVEKRLPEYAMYTEPHDSYYIGSDVFYTFIVMNNCWDIRLAQRTKEGYFSEAENLQKALLSGTFPDDIREKFRTMLEYFGASPIIVRSSSFLEDGFNNAFAGKYESVFCVNQGSPEERLTAFENAVRRVYASTMDISALEYRRQRGLDNQDEQMAILVQRVSGAFWGKLFFPAAAGVGYSYSVYRTSRDMDPAAGLLRIVAGLGTRAVDRPENDYPRLASLDRPAVSLYSSVADKHRYSQRNIDVLDISENQIKTLTFDSVMNDLPMWYKKAVMERDYEAENALERMNRWRQVWFVNCQKLLSNEKFTAFMQRMLKVLDEVYENPVDIEYTVNLDENGDFVVNLLQCRSLYTGTQGGQVPIPALPPEDIFFSLKDSSMGNAKELKIDAVVQIDPIGYYNYPYNKKTKVAEAVRQINLYYQKQGRHPILMTPGRVGTSSPELGVPVTFAAISGFAGICEISDSRAGYMPELSYGSHMFQDLVEADIFYSAVWNDKRTLAYREDFFKDLPNMFEEICPEFESLFEMFRVTEPEGLYYWNDVKSGRTLCGITSKGVRSE
ncbi:MAG: PEP/pyruvate-binding domain-containing protein [Lachnospiraceae bacterium]|nr:PEP/pyruvate-binding domain-containing protein [Lachnospiraceae bacterium]